MAKKQSIEDLEAELAKLEAEIASLDSGAALPPPEEKRKPAKKSRAARNEEPGGSPAPPEESSRSLKGLFKRKGASEAEAPPPPVETPAPAPSPEPASLPLKVPEAAPAVEETPPEAPARPSPVSDDSGTWVREGRGWRRTAPGGIGPRETLRRRMGQNGEVEFEEPVPSVDAPAGSAPADGSPQPRKGLFARFGRK